MFCFAVHVTGVCKEIHEAAETNCQKFGEESPFWQYIQLSAKQKVGSVATSISTEAKENVKMQSLICLRINWLKMIL
jgi:hypothetical protein